MTKNREGDMDVINAWTKEIQKVSRKAENDWPGVVEADDVAQEVVLHILERPGTVRDLSEMDRNSRYRTLHKIAQRIASRERDAFAVFSGSFRYSVGEVEKLMVLVGRYWNRTAHTPFTPSELGSAWSVGDSISTGRGEHSDPTANAGLDSIQKGSTRKDLLVALGKVNGQYLDILARKFVHCESGMGSTERSRLERALVELTNEMNHSYKQQHAGALVPGKSLGDGPGTRKAISNSTARYLSKEGYDSDYYPAPSHMRDNHIESEVWE